MKRKINLIGKIFSFAIILTAVTIGGCKRDSSNPVASSSPGPNEVWMQGMSFNPSAKTIAVGTTITWTNKDNTAHTVTSGTPGAPDGMFDSGNMNSGAAFSFKFTSAGTIKYYCVIHGAMMTATMTVQ